MTWSVSSSIFLPEASFGLWLLSLPTSVFVCASIQRLSMRSLSICSSEDHQTRTHYNDVIMGAIASQITSLTIVYSTVYSDADQRKHQSSASLAFVCGIHRGPVNSPHKWPVARKMFPFDGVMMKRGKTPWLRSLLILWLIDLDLQDQLLHWNQTLPHFKFVRTVDHHPLTIELPNSDKMGKTPWLRPYVGGWLNWLSRTNLT